MELLQISVNPCPFELGGFQTRREAVAASTDYSWNVLGGKQRGEMRCKPREGKGRQTAFRECKPSTIAIKRKEKVKIIKKTRVCGYPGQVVRHS